MEVLKANLYHDNIGMRLEIVEGINSVVQNNRASNIVSISPVDFNLTASQAMLVAFESVELESGYIPESFDYAIAVRDSTGNNYLSVIPDALIAKRGKWMMSVIIVEDYDGTSYSIRAGSATVPFYVINNIKGRNGQYVKVDDVTAIMIASEEAFERLQGKITEFEENIETENEYIVGEVAKAEQAAENAESYKNAASSSASAAEASNQSAISAKNSSQQSATAAAQSAAMAAQSASSAESLKNATAQLNADTEAVKAQTETLKNEAAMYVSNIESSAQTSKSYAVGGTGTRTDEDVDNAKYYSEKAQELYSMLRSLITSDDPALDTLQEVVDFIKENRTALEAVTINKVSITDIIDNLTSSAADKPLSANQGRILAERLTDKLNVSDIVDNVTTAESAKPLSAKQGKELNDRILAVEKFGFFVDNDGYLCQKLKGE